MESAEDEEPGRIESFAHSAKNIFEQVLTAYLYIANRVLPLPQQAADGDAFEAKLFKPLVAG